MGPKVKWWDTGLVCDQCGRKAAALTMIKPGEAGFNQVFDRGCVGKKLCYRCVSYKASMTRPYSNPLGSFFGRVTIALGAGCIVTFAVFFLAGDILTQSALLVLTGMLFILFGRVARRAGLMTQRRPMKAPSILVSTEGLFENEM